MLLNRYCQLNVWRSCQSIDATKLYNIGFKLKVLKNDAQRHKNRKVCSRESLTASLIFLCCISLFIIVWVFFRRSRENKPDSFLNVIINKIFSTCLSSTQRASRLFTFTTNMQHSLQTRKVKLWWPCTDMEVLDVTKMDADQTSVVAEHK